MDSNTTIEIATPFGEIIEKKVEYHTSQIEFHQKQIGELKHVAIKLGGHINAGNQINRTSHDMDVSLKEWTDDYITQRNVKPLVYEFLKNHPGQQFETTHIWDEFKARHGISNEKRKKWVSAISLSLFSLAKYGKAIAKESGVGRVKIYELKKE